MNRIRICSAAHTTLDTRDELEIKLRKITFHSTEIDGSYIQSEWSKTFTMTGMEISS
jgi:hypothetical protein